MVTVLMPVYNAERYLRQAIDSVLNQTYQEFILLLINDGSTDKSEQIIESYTDERIKYVKNEKNLGLVATLNKGLQMIHTKYIARMDADDICRPKRLEYQVQFMEANDGIALLGTWANLIDEDGKLVGSLTPYSDERRIRTALLFSNIFVHSSIMMRKSVLEENGWCYNQEHKAVEDYGLWIKFASKYQVAILEQKFLDYRLNSNGIMSSENAHMEKHIKNKSVIYDEIFEFFGIEHTLLDAVDYSSFVSNSWNTLDINGLGWLVVALRRVVCQDDGMDQRYFEVILSGILRSLGVKKKMNMKDYIHMLHVFFGYSIPTSIKECTKYFLTKIKTR